MYNMSGIEEVILVVVGTLIVIGSAKISRKIGVKINKRKLKKLLKLGFDKLDFDMIRKAMVGLMDYDSRNSSKKLDKYLNKIVKRYNVNTTKLNEALTDLSKMENIFDEDEIIEEEEEEPSINQEELDKEFVDIQLEEIGKRRKEILIRRNQIQQDRLGIIKKKQRRTIGKMG